MEPLMLLEKFHNSEAFIDQKSDITLTSPIVFFFFFLVRFIPHLASACIDQTN